MCENSYCIQKGKIRSKFLYYLKQTRHPKKKMVKDKNDKKKIFLNQYLSKEDAG